MKYISNIADRVRAAENRAAIIYARTDGKLYKWLRWLYIFSMFISVVMSLLYIGGRASHLHEITSLKLQILSSADIEIVKTSILTIGICTLVWIIAVILLIFKAEIVSCLMTIASGIVSCATLIAASKDTSQFNQGINENFWYRHFIPFILAAFFIIWLLIIKLRAEFNFRRAYINMVNRIYAQYHTEDLSEADWESFLKNYDPRAEEEKRRRAKKGIPEYKPIVENQDKQ